MTDDGLIGVWMLRAFHVEDVDTTERSEPFGPDPRGTIIFHPDGRMAALLTPRERPAPNHDIDPAAAFRQLVAYSGRFRLEPPDRLVTSVDVACFPAWVGTEQVRTYRLDGDRLDILTPASRMPRQGADPATVIGILSWTREGAVTTNGPAPI